MSHVQGETLPCEPCLPTGDDGSDGNVIIFCQKRRYTIEVLDVATVDHDDDIVTLVSAVFVQ